MLTNTAEHPLSTSLRTSRGRTTFMMSMRVQPSRNYLRASQAQSCSKNPKTKPKYQTPPHRQTGPSPSQQFWEMSMFRCHCQVWLEKSLFQMSLRNTTLCYPSIGPRCEETSLCVFPSLRLRHDISFQASIDHSSSYHELCAQINRTMHAGVVEEASAKAADSVDLLDTLPVLP